MAARSQALYYFIDTVLILRFGDLLVEVLAPYQTYKFRAINMISIPAKRSLGRA